MTKPFIVCYMMTTIEWDTYESIIANELRTLTLVDRVTAELEMATGKLKPTAIPELLGKQGFSKKVDSVYGFDIIVDTKSNLL
ncbi:hypothetical protein U3516DRAFT_740860 [Neocallimastix sp. 'constans']